MKILLPAFLGLFCVNSWLFSQQSIQRDSTVIKKIESLEEFVKKSSRLKITGWAQAQFQLTDSVGARTFDGGDFASNSNNRFMIRRGRVKFNYTHDIVQAVLQLNATERGVNLVEFFGKITDPWTKSLSFTMGVMNRPYGFEIQQSSSDRETPERARFTQVLLPNERDLGAMISFQPVKESKLFGLKIDAGLYNGVGIAVPGTTSLNGAGIIDFDKYKDFIGRISYKKAFKNDKYTLGLGVSHYNGGVLYQNNLVFDEITTNSSGIMTWNMRDTTSGIMFKGGKSPRIYFGGDIQFSLKSILGTTTLRGEYISGTQTGTIDENKSPGSLPSKADTYQRSFGGGYLYFIHRIAKSKHEIALKYDWYDPNSKISSSDMVIGSAFTKAELKYSMIGLGYNFYLNENVKFMAYYNLVKNEIATGIIGFGKDLKDNVLTLRVQYRF